MFTLNPQILGALLLVFILSLGVVTLFAYNKGYSVAETECKLDKLNRIEEQLKKSKEIADKADILLNDLAKNSELTNVKLDKVLRDSKQKPVTNVPCTPNSNFVDTWNNLKKEAK